MNYLMKLFNFLIIFNYFFLTKLFSTSETMYNNQFSIFCLDNMNKYLIIISFIIFLLSYISMMNNLFTEGKLIFAFLFFFTILLFTTMNLLLFFLLLEGVLIPMIYLFYYYSEYKKRLLSLSYMFLMTLIFSSPFLLFVLIGFNNSMETYLKNFCTMNNFFFFLLILSFLMKLPIYSLHYWLPKAHVDAPVSGSMILASVMLKYSGYSLIRSMYIFNMYNFYYYFFLLMFFFSSFSYLIMAYLCIQILDLKVLIAFSSVSHMSFAILSNINCNFMGLKSSLLMYISHSLISPLMFFMAFILYNMFHTRLLNSISSLSKFSYIKYSFFIILLMNLGFPPFMNFISEIFIFSSCFMFMFLLILFFFLGFFFGSVYHIKLFTLLFNSSNYSFFMNTKNNFFFFFFVFYFFMYFFIFLSFFLIYI